MLRDMIWPNGLWEFLIIAVRNAKRPPFQTVFLMGYSDAEEFIMRIEGEMRPQALSSNPNNKDMMMLWTVKCTLPSRQTKKQKSSAHHHVVVYSFTVRKVMIENSRKANSSSEPPTITRIMTKVSFS